MCPVDCLTWDDGKIDSITAGGFRMRAETVLLTQSTGIRDVAGSEIFEGDVVRPDDGLWDGTQLSVVVYEGGCFVTAPKHSDIALETGSCPRMLGLGSFRIIGNIHEDPDLLA
jgi:uncharacterized phage protein (TIGR01671 family)